MQFKPTSSFLKKPSNTPTEQFRLNPSAQSSFQNPLPKRDPKKRLQSIQDPRPSTFTPTTFIESKFKDPKFMPKKLAPELARTLQASKEQIVGENKQMEVEAEINEDYIKPSLIYQPAEPLVDLQTPTIFQIPLLPCFEEEKVQYNPKPDHLQEMIQHKYDSNGELISQNYTNLAKEGLWKIGKMKIKRNEVNLLIAGIKMKGRLSNGEGKAIVINQNDLFDLGNWSGMWVAEPSDDLFDEESK